MNFLIKTLKTNEKKQTNQKGPSTSLYVGLFSTVGTICSGQSFRYCP